MRVAASWPTALSSPHCSPHSTPLPSFGVFLDALIGRKGAAADAAAERAKEVTLWRSEAEGLQAVARLRARLSFAAPQKSSPQVAGDDRTAGSAQPLIEVRLRPDQLAVMLDRAADEDERTAWATGRAFDGQSRRLLLAAIPPASLVVGKQGNVDDTRAVRGRQDLVAGALHAEGPR